jgi:hypothetical protein
MTAMTLHCQLDKKQQCANWSKRPLTQSLKDYAAMDVTVMIDIYDRLKTKIKQDGIELFDDFQQLIETSIDLNQIILYRCICGERFITNKTRNKHARTCIHEQQRIEAEAAAAAAVNTSTKSSQKKKSRKQFINNSDPVKPQITEVSSLPELDFDAPAPCGRGYVPPALKRAYQTMNQISLHEQVRCSSAFDEFNQLNGNRPPDAQFFLEDDDTEVAQAFGLEIRNKASKMKMNRIKSNISSVSVPKQNNLKIAAYPPKPNFRMFRKFKILIYSFVFYLEYLNIEKPLVDENDLLDRLKDDFDSQPEFHCHLFGLGGRGRATSMHLSPPEPSFIKRNVQ